MVAEETRKNEQDVTPDDSNNNTAEETSTPSSSSPMRNTKSEDTTSAVKSTNSSSPGGGGRSAYKVRFLEGTVGRERTTKGAMIKPRNRPNNRKASHVGAADPVRDLCLFVGFMAFMFLLSYVYQDVGKGDNDSPKSVIGKMKSMRKNLQSAVENMDAKNPPRLDCDLYLAVSSIPQAGFGIFAGKNYTPGDFIMNLGWPVLEIPNSGHEDEGFMNSNSSNSKDQMMVTPLGLLLKHHPIRFNVEPNQALVRLAISTEQDNDAKGDDSLSHSPILLHATKSIEAGQELFLDFDSHPHSKIMNLLPLVFEPIPTSYHYREADEIIKDMKVMVNIKTRGGKEKRKGSELGTGIRMVQRAVKRYQPTVAALLPSLLDNLMEYILTPNSTCAILALHEQSKTSLGRYGQCLSDIRKGMATKTISPGERIFPAPLYVRTKQNYWTNHDHHSNRDGQEDLSCGNNNYNRDEDSNYQSGNNIDVSKACASSSSPNRFCVSHPDISVEVCPLVEFDTHVHHVALSKDNSPKINAFYQWSKWKQAVNGTIKHTGDIVEEYATGLVWEAISLRDIQPGEKIVIGMDQDPKTGDWLIPDTLVPEKWKRRAEQRSVEYAES